MYSLLRLEVIDYDTKNYYQDKLKKNQAFNLIIFFQIQ